MKRWTKDEEELLRVMVEKGYLYSRIGEKLDRTIRSVQGKCNNLHITNNIHRNIKHTNTSYDIKLLEINATVARLGNYIDVETPILHKCLVCNSDHLATPKDKFAGYGHCGTRSNGGGISRDKEGITYLVYITEYNLYKFGITGKTTKKRMSDLRIYDYELILERNFALGVNAMLLEQKWKENLKEFLVNTGLLRGGNTETFRI